MNKETISEYYLERYALGELPDEELEDIRRLSSTNPEVQAALDDITASNSDIRKEVAERMLLKSSK